MCELEGECKSQLIDVANDQFYGLIAPGIEMADILAFNLVSLLNDFKAYRRPKRNPTHLEQ